MGFFEKHSSPVFLQIILKIRDTSYAEPKQEIIIKVVCAQNHQDNFDGMNYI
jgi:hypothetical protein